MKPLRLYEVKAEYVSYLSNYQEHIFSSKGKGYKSLLCSIFDYACLKKLITRNPAKWINLEHYFKDCNHSAKPVNERIFTHDEIKSIQNFVREKIKKRPYNPQNYAILFSIESGLRVGEIPPLRWSDIQNGLIHVYRQQIHTKVKNGPDRFEFVDYTKNERTFSVTP